MKRMVLLIIGLMTVSLAGAQKSVLSLDEHNKYIYYQVVDLPGITQDSLQKNAAYFLASSYPKTKPAPANSGMHIKDKFLTYASFVKHENGQVSFSLNVECKNGKYRYWLTDFVFTPYQRDRYGVYVPENGIEIPLESAESKVNKKELDGYFDQTGAFCKQLGEKLKKVMTEGFAAKKTDQLPVKKIVTEKW